MAKMDWEKANDRDRAKKPIEIPSAPLGVLSQKKDYSEELKRLKENQEKPIGRKSSALDEIRYKQRH